MFRKIVRRNGSSGGFKFRFNRRISAKSNFKGASEFGAGFATALAAIEALPLAAIVALSLAAIVAEASIPDEVVASPIFEFILYSVKMRLCCVSYA